jgi:uncharacterized membrane protein YebE (DUF533 family)
MLADFLLRSMVHSALGVRRKPYLGAASFLTGGRSPILNLGTMLGVAGLAWGAYETYKNHRPTESITTVAGGGFPASEAPMLAGGPPPLPSTRPPPLPATAGAVAAPSAPAGPDALRRLVALTIAAARCDNELSEEEYGKIREDARASGAENLVSEELARKRPLAEIVAGADNPKLKADLYVLSYGIVRADGVVSSNERVWLAELAGLLGLDAAAVADLERRAGENIDRGTT